MQTYHRQQCASNRSQDRRKRGLKTPHEAAEAIASALRPALFQSSISLSTVKDEGRSNMLFWIFFLLGGLARIWDYGSIIDTGSCFDCELDHAPISFYILPEITTCCSSQDEHAQASDRASQRGLHCYSRLSPACQRAMPLVLGQAICFHCGNGVEH